MTLHINASILLFALYAISATGQQAIKQKAIPANQNQQKTMPNLSQNQGRK